MLNIAITRGENWPDKGFLGYEERNRMAALADTFAILLRRLVVR